MAHRGANRTGRPGGALGGEGDRAQYEADPRPPATHREGPSLGADRPNCRAQAPSEWEEAAADTHAGREVVVVGLVVGGTQLVVSVKFLVSGW